MYSVLAVVERMSRCLRIVYTAVAVCVPWPYLAVN